MLETVYATEDDEEQQEPLKNGSTTTVPAPANPLGQHSRLLQNGTSLSTPLPTTGVHPQPPPSAAAAADGAVGGGRVKKMASSSPSSTATATTPLANNPSPISLTTATGQPQPAAQQQQQKQQQQTSQQAESAIRLKLIRAEIADDNLPEGAQLGELNCAVNVKEKVEINGENRLIQKRKTMQVEWEKTFDVGVLPGRVLQILVHHGKTQVADATMRLEDIVSKSKHDAITHVWINLKPDGRILAQTRKIGESSDRSSEEHSSTPRLFGAGGGSGGTAGSVGEHVQGIGLQRRRGAIKHAKVHEIRGHRFMATFFRQPTFCSLCSEFMW